MSEETDQLGLPRSSSTPLHSISIESSGEIFVDLEESEECELVEMVDSLRFKNKDPNYQSTAHQIKRIGNVNSESLQIIPKQPQQLTTNRVAFPLSNDQFGMSPMSCQSTPSSLKLADCSLSSNKNQILSLMINSQSLQSSGELVDQLLYPVQQQMEHIYNYQKSDRMIPNGNINRNNFNGMKPQEFLRDSSEMQTVLDMGKFRNMSSESEGSMGKSGGFFYGQPTSGEAYQTKNAHKDSPNSHHFTSEVNYINQQNSQTESNGSNHNLNASNSNRPSSIVLPHPIWRQQLNRDRSGSGGGYVSYQIGEVERGTNINSDKSNQLFNTGRNNCSATEQIDDSRQSNGNYKCKPAYDIKDKKGHDFAIHRSREVDWNHGHWKSEERPVQNNSLGKRQHKRRNNQRNDDNNPKNKQDNESNLLRQTDHPLHPSPFHHPTNPYHPVKQAFNNSSLINTSTYCHSPQTPSTPLSPPPSLSLTKAVRCTCKKSQCMKDYCLCFKYGQSCSNDCKCQGCQNGKEQFKTINLRDIKDKKDSTRRSQHNYDAFLTHQPQKIGHQTANEGTRHLNQPHFSSFTSNYLNNPPSLSYGGSPSTTPSTPSQLSSESRCTCQKSKCRKDYCICFRGGRPCNDKCKCISCCNKVRLFKYKDSREQIMDQINLEGQQMSVKEISVNRLNDSPQSVYCERLPSYNANSNNQACPSPSPLLMAQPDQPKFSFDLRLESLLGYPLQSSTQDKQVNDCS